MLMTGSYQYRKWARYDCVKFCMKESVSASWEGVSLKSKSLRSCSKFPGEGWKSSIVKLIFSQLLLKGFSS